jgi:hypothetical protein
MSPCFKMLELNDSVRFLENIKADVFYFIVERMKSSKLFVASAAPCQCVQYDHTRLDRILRI